MSRPYSLRTSLFAFVSCLLVATVASASPAPLSAILSVDNSSANTGDPRVRVVHASPDAPAVDVLVNDAVAFAAIPFQDITAYAALPAGTYNVKVVPAGATGPVVIEADLDLMAGTDYTVIATDVLASITPVVAVDDNMAPAAGNAKVRFFHGSPDAPAVDIALTDGPVLFGNVSFGDFAASPLEVPAGTYDLEVRVAGTDTVVLTLPGLALAADTVYTAYATGLVADGAADRTLYLNNDRFRLDVDWADFQGERGFGRQVSLTDDTGYFWFFNDTNVELTVKVLDATANNNAFWVFFGSLSNVEFELRVTDTATGATKTYLNPLGTFASEGDTSAFPQ